MGHDLASMQDHQAVIGMDLVVQMSRPEHAQAVFLAEAMYMLDDRLPAGDVDAVARAADAPNIRAAFTKLTGTGKP